MCVCVHMCSFFFALMQFSEVVSKCTTTDAAARVLANLDLVRAGDEHRQERCTNFVVGSREQSLVEQDWFCVILEQKMTRSCICFEGYFHTLVRCKSF